MIKGFLNHKLLANAGLSALKICFVDFLKSENLTD